MPGQRTLERRLPRSHFIKNRAEGIQIATNRCGAAFKTLRRHEGRRADRHTALFRLPDQCGNAEVGDPHLTAAIDHDVGRLEVTVQYALIMGSPQTGAQLTGNLDRLVAAEPADAAQQRGEVFAIDVFHRDEDFPFRLADVIDARHVGMRYSASQPNLVSIAKQPGCIVAATAARNFNATD